MVATTWVWAAVARRLLFCTDVDRGIIASATELFLARQFPGVVAVVSDALEQDPECVELLLLRARARIGLRRDLEAQADLRDVIRLEPHRAIAYRLLGQLAARRGEHDSAAIFFREALRLDPGDNEASDWLAIVDAPSGPAAVAHILPAPAAAAGRTLTRKSGRIALGTQPPDEDASTTPFPRSTLTEPAALSPTPHPKPTSAPRGPVPELPGFADYLISAGILTPDRLRAAQAYQRSMGVLLSTAIVTLGLASPQRIEWAAVAHQSELARAHTLRR